MSLTKEELVRGFQALGLRNGDIVLAHSSLASLGEVEGGADTVVDALIVACGPDGTVMMPTMGGKRPWHVKESQSGLGIITETFRRRPDVIRSIHPTHSVAARGPRSEELLKDHYKAPTACGRGTPYARLIDADGKILLIGCDQDRNTTLHTIEDFADLPYLSTQKAGPFYDENGELREITMQRYPGPHRDFIGIDRLLRESGIMRVGKVGQAVCRLMQAKGTHDVLLEAFRKDKAAVLCDNPNCEDCIWQRGKIKEHRLRTEEDFVLTASTDIMGNTVPKIILACRGEGILQLELSTLGTKDVLELTDEEMEGLKKTGAKFGIQITAVRSNKAPGEVGGLVQAAKKLGAETVHVPLTKEVLEKIEQADTGGVRFLVENNYQGAEECLKLMESVKGRSISFAFNSANFARQGQHPFLGVYYRRRNKLNIGELVIADGTYEGDPTLPGQGSGEVKELISILRSRSFRGALALRGPLAAGTTFRQHAAAFWHLLDTM